MRAKLQLFSHIYNIFNKKHITHRHFSITHRKMHYFQSISIFQRSLWARRASVGCGGATFHVRKRTFHAPLVRFMRQSRVRPRAIQLTIDSSYLTFARTITRRARVRQLIIDNCFRLGMPSVACSGAALSVRKRTFHAPMVRFMRQSRVVWLFYVVAQRAGVLLFVSRPP